MNTRFCGPELLESRIAPAAIYVFTDVDGDTVTLKSSKGNSGDLKNIMEEHRVSQGSGFRINEIDLTFVPMANFGEFANTNLTISVKRGPHGDGHVDIGEITATNTPLGSVIAPKASIQQLDCGDGTHAIGKLVVGSYGTAAPAYFNNGISDSLGLVDGSVGSINIAGDIAYGGLDIENPLVMIPTITVGSIHIGGNLNGAAGVATQDAGDLFVFAAKVGSISVKGSVIGGTISSTSSEIGSGILETSEAGFVKVLSIEGNVIGGAGAESGSVQSNGGTFTLGGSVIGGSNAGAGSVTAGGKVVTVKGSVIGGVTNGITNVGAGSLDLFFGAGTVNILGDLVAGRITGGTTNLNGCITCNGVVGALHIGGSVLGSNANRALILVEGFMSPKFPDAINSITIGGSLEYAIIASGHNIANAATFDIGDATNPNGGIGKVTIGGNFYHSTIFAGTNDLGAIGAGHVTTVSDDTQSVGTAGNLATLGPVVIKGALLDDASAVGDSGFEGAQITSITAGGVQIYKHGDGLTFFDPNKFIFAEEITPT